MLMSEKITLIISIWILFVLFITGNENIELFFILILVGVLIIRELSDKFTSIHLKDRMNIIIYIFVFIFIIIVGKKILTILNM